jgi:hypothetical protein
MVFDFIELPLALAGGEGLLDSVGFSQTLRLKPRVGNCLTLQLKLEAIQIKSMTQCYSIYTLRCANVGLEAADKI